MASQEPSKTTQAAENLSRRELLRRAALTAGGIALTAAPASVSAQMRRVPPGYGGAQGGPGGDDYTERNIDDITKGFTKLAGVINLYRKDNDLYAEIGRDQLSRHMMIQATRATGTAGDYGVVGDPLSDTVFSFHLLNDQLYMIAPNPRFRATPGTPEAVSIQRSFTDAYLTSFPIEAIRIDPAAQKALAAIKDHDKKVAAAKDAAVSYLIHIPTLFLSDILGFTDSLPGYAIDQEKTFLKNVQNFPDNLVVTTQYHFSGHPAGLAALFMQMEVDTLADDRSIPMRVIYNLFLLKDTGYRPRMYDDRVGYFTEDYEEFNNDTEMDNTKRMILRWNLVKKDPKAALSEPVNPIHFWVDNATPLRYRDAIREGVLLWNPVFEKIGFKNAIQCDVMPDGADWDPADMRHNVVRWVSSVDAGYAVAQFRHNPITGEMLNASITLDASMARFSNLDYPLISLTDFTSQTPDLLSTGAATPTDGSGATGQPTVTPQMLADAIVNPKPTKMATNFCRCDMGKGTMASAAHGWDVIDMIGTPGSQPPTLQDFTNSYLRAVICHETGHCLGLRHNFKGSTLLTPAQLQDPKAIAEYGITSSVMDYCPANVAPLHGTQADFFTPKPGPYDEWAIAYGYTDFGNSGYEEELGLRQLAAQSTAFGHDFASDEVADSFDPSVTRFDLSADPLAWRINSVERASFMIAQLPFRNPADGDSYFNLTRRFTRIVNQYIEHTLAVSRFVGGLITERNHFGDPNALPPVRPVPAADQRRALATLCAYMYSDAALDFPPNLLSRLEADPAPYGPFTPDPEMSDMSYLDAIAMVQSVGLNTMLNAGTLGRVESNEMRSNPTEKAITVIEVMNTITDAIWSEIKPVKPANSACLTIRPLRRRLQRAYIDAVTALARPSAGEMEMGGETVSGAPTGDAGAFAMTALNRVGGLIANAQKRACDDTTAAHLSEIRLRIRRFLHAQAIVS